VQVIIVFVLFSAALDAVGVGICMVIERYSEYASLLVFLGLFVVNFVIAWQLAMFVTERFLVTDAQKAKDEDHRKWVNSLFIAARR
jgi:hypothetical protein